MKRRDFIKNLSGSIALIASGCTKPEYEIVPAVMPDGSNQVSKPVFYNTIYTGYDIPYGITVKTIDGRPVKIDHNPDSPINPNGTNALIQASIFSLYNPNRFFKPLSNNKELSIEEFTKMIQSRVEQKGDYDNIVIIDKASSSPSYTKLKQDISKMYRQVSFYDFQVDIEPDIPMSFFTNNTKKKIIVSLGMDILGSSKYSLAAQCSFGKGNFELIVAEPYLTLTGLASKVRETRSIIELNMLSAIIYQIILKRKSGIISQFPLIPQEYRYLEKSKLISYLVDNPDLDIQLLCPNWLDQRSRLMATQINSFNLPQFNNSSKEINRLKMNISVNSLVFILNREIITQEINTILKQTKIANKLYFAKTKKDIPKDFYYVLPESNELENWGMLTDSSEEFFFIQQPIVRKLNIDSISKENFLLNIFPLNESVPDYYSYLKKYLNIDDEEWQMGLQVGYFTKKKQTSLSTVRSEKSPIVDFKFSDDEKQSDLLKLLIVPDIYKYNGVDWDNPFIDVLAHPINKLVTTHPAIISEKTAARYKLSNGDVVLCKSKSSVWTCTILIQLGTADNHLIMEKVDSLDLYGLHSVELLKTKKHKKLVFDDYPKIIKLSGDPKDYSIDDLQKMKRKKEAGLQLKNSFPGSFKYLKDKWEMKIDQLMCTGCNACVIACQIENNVSIVNLEDIENEGAMNWLRINTYLYDSSGDIKGEFEPLMCQHCENAPCETVCPVGATSQGPQGLNEMTYNRCIGARLCMVNCPYGVRRFNFRDHSKNIEAPLELLLNPNVTVRSIGVAEKCTFCIQRLNEFNLNIQTDNQTQSFMTACQQSCPTSAINIGSFINSKTKMQTSEYRILVHLNTLPAITYRNKFRNDE